MGFSRSFRMATVAAVVALQAGTASPAGAAPEGLQYQFTMRATPVEGYLYYTRELVQGLGFTRVQLAQTRGDAAGAARALSAAVWPITDEEPCLLGCEPPCPESTVVNPTVARTSMPRDCNDRVPGVGAVGLPPQLATVLSGDLLPELIVSTPTDSIAAGTARLVDPTRSNSSTGATLGAIFATAGSTSRAQVNRSTGRFSALAQSFVTDLRLPGGRLATVTSRLEINARPDRMPEVSYLLALIAGSDSRNASGVDNTAFTVVGTRVPIVNLVSDVNAQLTGLGSQLGLLGTLGIRVLAPTVEWTDAGSRFRVSAPVLLLGAEPGVNLPAPTQDAGVRIGTAGFAGSYTAPDPPLR